MSLGSVPSKIVGPDFEALTPRSKACIERLSLHEPPYISLSRYPSSKLAAVLILLYEKESCLRVLLTTRSRFLRSHPFQTALPGGKLDPNDSDLSAAAFREANEEVGLPMECPSVHVLCHLRPFLSLYRLLVTPVVAVLTDLSILENLTPSRAEVDKMFDHPLEALLEPTLAINEPLSPMGEELWPYETEIYNTSDNISPFGIYRMHRFRSSYTPIKGLTADILITAAEIAYDRKASFEKLAPGQSEPFVNIFRVIGEHVELQVTAFETQNSETGEPASYET